MKMLKSLLMGIAAGLLLSLSSLIIPYLGHLLIAGRPALPLAIIGAGLAIGLVAGPASVALLGLSGGRERALLVLLISTAVASLAVYVGGYSNRSLIPPAIYVLALVNGLLIAKATARLAVGRDSRRAILTTTNFAETRE